MREASPASPDYLSNNGAYQRQGSHSEGAGRVPTPTTTIKAAYAIRTKCLQMKGRVHVDLPATEGGCCAASCRPQIQLPVALCTEVGPQPSEPAVWLVWPATWPRMSGPTTTRRFSARNVARCTHPRLREPFCKQKGNVYPSERNAFSQLSKKMVCSDTTYFGSL